MERKKFKFSFIRVMSNCYIKDFKSKGIRRNDFLKENIFNSYACRYDIQKREKVETVKYYNTGYKKETRKVSWVEDIFNIKVKVIGHRNSYGSNTFKISFKIYLSPREAYIIGRELDKKFRDVSYKEIKGQHGC